MRPRSDSASGHGAPSRASESERRARVMDLQVEQAKREAQRRLEEERKRAENLEQERQLQVIRTPARKRTRIRSRKIAIRSSA